MLASLAVVASLGVAPVAHAQDPAATPSPFCAILTPDEVSAALKVKVVVSTTPSISDNTCSWDAADSSYTSLLVSVVPGVIDADLRAGWHDYTDAVVAGQPALLAPDGTGLFVQTDQGLLMVDLIGVVGDGAKAIEAIPALGAIAFGRLPSIPLATPTPAPTEAPAPSFGGAADLVAMFPTTIGGQPVTPMAITGQQIGLAITDPTRLKLITDGLTAVGKTLDDVDIAIAGSTLIAIRVHGASATDALTALLPFLEASATDPVMAMASVAGKAVLKITDGPDSPTATAGAVYIYPKDDVLWAIKATDPTLTEVLTALPWRRRRRSRSLARAGRLGLPCGGTLGRATVRGPMHDAAQLSLELPAAGAARPATSDQALPAIDLAPEWKEQPLGWPHALHPLCTYLGSLPAAVAHALIARWSRPGDVVLDPFSGRGSVPLQACLERRIGVGVDASPLAHLLTAAVVDPPSLRQALDRLTRLHIDWTLEADTWRADARAMIERDAAGGAGAASLFHPETLAQLLFLRHRLERRSQVDGFLLAALAGILHGRRASNLSEAMPNGFSLAPGYTARWLAERGGTAPLRPVFRLLERRLRHLFREGTPAARGIALQGDARTAGTRLLPLLEARALPAKVRLVVTSPPYLRVVRYGVGQLVAAVAARARIRPPSMPLGCPVVGGWLGGVAADRAGGPATRPG